MKYRKILVTGGAGYLGSQLVRDLKSYAKKIVILDNFTRGGESLLNLPKSRYKIIKGSILDTDLVDFSVEGANIVIHLASVVGINYSFKHPEITKRVNVEGTKILIKACERSDVHRFIFSSTSAIYGNVMNAKESSSVNPLDPYSESKKEAENLLKKAGFDVVIFRMSTLFGCSPNMRFDLVINRLVFSAIKNGSLTLFNGGEHWRPFMYIKDCSRAFCKFVNSGKPGIYNLGGINCQIRDIAKMIKGLMPETKVLSQNNPISSYTLNFEKITKAGFKLKYNIKQGISEMVKNYNDFKDCY
jgi:nucleoside-diphosphate-sugar epimerase